MAVTSFIPRLREITLANTSFGSLESATEISISNV